MNDQTTKLAALAFAVFCSGGLFAPSVAAQTAAMLPPQKDVKASSAEHAEAMAFVYETLVEQGVKVVADETEVEKMLIEKGLHKQCQSATGCGSKIAGLLGVDFVVSTVVWTDQSVQKRPQSVAVGLITPEGQSHNGVSDVRDGNIKEASRQATLKALQDRDAKQMGWLVVQSTPSGASVELDGAPSGKTPYKRMVPVGKHTLKLSAQGYSSVSRDITVSKKATATTTVTLEPGESDDSSDSDWWKYGAPITVAGVGLAGLLVLGGVAIFGTGCDSEYPSGACQDESELDTTSAVIWGSISGALLVAGGGWLIWNLSEDSDNDAGKGTTAQLRLTPTGVSVQGRF